MYNDSFVAYYEVYYYIIGVVEFLCLWLVSCFGLIYIHNIICLLGVIVLLRSFLKVL